MDLITPQDLLKATPALKYFGGNYIARLLYHKLRLDEINSTYNKFAHCTPGDFVKGILQSLNATYTVPDTDLDNIPKEGSFITISNHPFGGLDGIILARIFPEVRPDYKILVNWLLTKLEPLKPYFLGVNPFETHKDVKSSFGGLKDAILHISNGHPIGIFPAGEVSTYHFQNRSISDKEWQYSILKFIKKSRVPILPVYIDGHNSLSFHLLGMVHPILRTAKLPSELVNKKGKHVNIRIGLPIPVKEQDEFRDIREYGRMLRGMTYPMSAALKQPRRHFSIQLFSPSPVIPPVDPQLIEAEVNGVCREGLLFRIKEDSVFCVPTERIPNIMREIGRLREITYREIGEGTNKSIDIDRYDSYFEQLFIWNETEKKIIGGYRVGKGNKVMDLHGLDGFYISSLFRISPSFFPVLRVSMELGRSFIVKDFQRRPLSLFLLWKGILYMLLKHPEYRYLIGPVSITNEFLDISKALTVRYLKAHHFNSEFGKLIIPRKPFKDCIPGSIDIRMFERFTENEIGRLEKFIQNIDPHYKTPVLLKKYLSVNAEILGFNIDPLFNNCLDALTILDIFEVPQDTIEALSKEINDQSILERFRK